MTYVFKGAPFVCVECPGWKCIMIVGGQKNDGAPILPDKCPHTGAPAPWTQEAAS